MRVLAIVHQPDAGPGGFAEAMHARGVQLDQWMIAEAPQPADPLTYDAVLTFGGAMHPDRDSTHPWLRDEKALLEAVIRERIPLLGMCLGTQLVAAAAGAVPRRAREPEIGWHVVELTPQGADDPVLSGLPQRFEAFQWHSYEAPLPPGATALAASDVCLQAYRLEGPAWGIQFHAEVSAADAEYWIDDYRSDPDAVRIGLDPEALRHRTREAIGAWNEMGRVLCERFLETATRA
jgi:GMP synthase-like glutamine amidotransferase